MRLDTTAIRYRRTKSGEWVAYGPVRLVRIGEVEVLTANGERRTETVTRVGKAFSVGGVQMTYGYLAPRSTSAPKRRECVSGGNCSSIGSGRSCGGHDCDGY